MTDRQTEKRKDKLVALTQTGFLSFPHMSLTLSMSARIGPQSGFTSFIGGGDNFPSLVPVLDHFNSFQFSVFPKSTSAALACGFTRAQHLRHKGGGAPETYPQRPAIHTTVECQQLSPRTLPIAD